MRIQTPRSLAFGSVTCLALLAAGCADQAPPLEPDASEPRAAPDRPNFINNGVPTGNDFASVGALLYDFNQDGVIDGDDLACSGSLIAPTVFLTAAHCVILFPAGTPLYVSFSPDLYDAATIIAATGFAYDPRFPLHHTPAGPIIINRANLYDLAVVFLPAEATAHLTPLQLPPSGALSTLAAQGGLNGHHFINAGYGVDAAPSGPPSFFYDGVRKRSLSPFMALQPTWLGLLMNQHATGQGGDCGGDSGSPKFLEGNTTTIYALVSWGDRVCRATSWGWRLDTPQARSFLGQYLDLP
jgi:hypothetical protein